MSEQNTSRIETSQMQTQKNSRDSKESKLNKVEEQRKKNEEWAAKRGERIIKAEDSFEDAGKKLAKAREEYLKAENEAAVDTDGEDIEGRREFRSATFQEFVFASDEIMRRLRVDLER